MGAGLFASSEGTSGTATLGVMATGTLVEGKGGKCFTVWDPGETRRGSRDKCDECSTGAIEELLLAEVRSSVAMVSSHMLKLVFSCGDIAEEAKGTVLEGVCPWWTI